VAEEHGHRQWRATARIAAAWAAAVRHPGAEAAAAVTNGIEEYSRMGLRAQLSAFLGLAAGACVEAGQRQRALALLDRADAHAGATSERWYDAELHRLRGVVAPPHAAEAHFERALDVSRAQGAKLWELRATTSLARLCGRRQRDRARTLLDAVLPPFADEHDATDVAAARTLRRALG
jgi:predicted ATPase